jgi:transcription initiation factor TFIID subunit 5
MLKLWDLHGSKQKTEDAQAYSSSVLSSMSLLQSYPTKATPVFTVNFSHRNLLMGSGALTIRKKQSQS